MFVHRESPNTLDDYFEEKSGPKVTPIANSYSERIRLNNLALKDIFFIFIVRLTIYYNIEDR